MTRPLERVEEIVARCETYQYSLPRDEQRALIASWRLRGEALKEARDVVERANEERWAGAFDALHSIDTALKAKP